MWGKDLTHIDTHSHSQIKPYFRDKVKGMWGEQGVMQLDLAELIQKGEKEITIWMKVKNRMPMEMVSLSLFLYYPKKSSVKCVDVERSDLKFILKQYVITVL